MKGILQRKPALAFVIPALIFAISAALTVLPLPNEVFIGITYDMIIVAPALYFLAIRKTSIPNITVVPVMVAGVILGGYLIPSSHQEHYALLEGVLLPLVELVVLSVAGIYSYRTVREMRRTDTFQMDFFQIFEQSLNKVMHHPRLAKILSIEFGGIYYAFFVWKKRKLKTNEFSYQSDTGLMAILYTVIAITILETFVLHILISRLSVAWALVLTLLSIYGGIMILAQIKTIRRRPHIIGEEYFELKNGLFGYAKINYSHISNLEITQEDLPEDQEKTWKMALLGSLEQHNMKLTTTHPIVVEGPYGKKKVVDTLYFHVDRPEAFRNTLLSKVEQ